MSSRSLRSSRPSTQASPAEGSQHQPDGEQSEPYQPKVKRKNSSSACNTCRELRIRCSGAAPCTYCKKHNKPCTIDQDGDQRRHRKRTLDELRLRSDSLDSLLEALETLDDEEIKPILHLIRQKAPLEEIVECACNLSNSSNNQELAAALDRVSESPPS